MGNPFLGVVFHWLGGLASGSFYVPYRGVKKWSWETYWLVGGIFSWIICPWVLATLLTSDVVGVLKQQSGSTLWWTYFFGAMWGFGGLTFGLTMRYLGMSLGMGVALGYCAAFGTLVPPIFKYFMPSLPVGSSIQEIASKTSGQVTLAGVAICLIGIAIAAFAGLTKEREMPEAQKKQAIKEFNFKKGILVATFSGIMSACFAFGLTAANPIKASTLQSDYVHAAKADGIAIADVPPLDQTATASFLDSLKTTAFFQKAPEGGQNRSSIDDVVDQIENPVAVVPQLQDSIVKLKAKLSGLTGADADKTAKQIADLEAKVSDILTMAPQQAQLLSESTDAIAVRLGAYSASLSGLSGKTNEIAIIHGLKTLPIKEVAVSIVKAGGDLVKYNSKHELWQGLPALIVILLGGFTTNFIWCLLLNIKNKTGYQYFASHLREEYAQHGGGATAMGGSQAPDLKIPAFTNYLFSALAGTTWYFQFFFYQMGTTQMGRYDFASWTLHMASIIIFSTIWGWIFHEWKGSSKKAHLLIGGGISTLVLSTVVIGLGAAMNDGKSIHDIVGMIFGK
jgi:hypothetical protein